MYNVLLEDNEDIISDDIVWVFYLTSSFRLVEPIEFIPHPGGLGLGATPKPPEPKKNKIKKPGEIERKVCTCTCIYIIICDNNWNSCA